jgi:MoaA/NifB/PqqE/SkfB family radical SAM enzyme
MAWLNELNSHACMGIGFGGGEPTLHRGLPELCNYARRHTAMAVTFTTHAHRVNEGLAARLAGSVDFIRVSMDGVGATYQSMRGRSFDDLARQLQLVRRLAPFGINYVVNQETVADLEDAVQFAAGVGAIEFLLLPQRRGGNAGDIDLQSSRRLQHWVEHYRGPLLLTISESGAEGLPVCNPLIRETGLCAYAHIDASGVLKRSSFDRFGVPIGTTSILQALCSLRALGGGEQA